MKGIPREIEEQLNSMSFNSYLFATNFPVTQHPRKQGDVIHRLAVYTYSIPVSFVILVSQDARMCHSLMKAYETPIAIQGNFEKGKQKLFEFLDRLLSENVFENNERLENLIAETKAFLNENKLEYITLEGSEVHVMGGEKLEKEYSRFFEETILGIDDYIEDRLNSLKSLRRWSKRINKKVLKHTKPKHQLTDLIHLEPVEHIMQLKVNALFVESLMWNMLGIGDWKDVVYLHHKKEM